MMIRPFGLVAGHGKRRRGDLEGRVIGDVKPPVAVKPRSLACSEIAVNDCEKIGDFLAAGFVLLEPPEL
jgi:hypothetical protein